MSLPKVEFYDKGGNITTIESGKSLMNNDVLFKEWMDRNSLAYTKLCNSNGDTIEDIVLKDSMCRTRQLRYHHYNLKQICKGCRNVRFMLEYPTVTTSFEIMYGANKGKVVDYKRYDYGGEMYRRNDELKNLSNDLTRKSAKYCKSEFYKLNNIYYYTVKNKYVNKYCMNIVVKEIMKNKKFKLCPSFIWGYSCNSKLNMIFNQPDYKFNTLKVNSKYIRNGYFDKVLVVNIIKQLVSQCRILSNYYFVHNEPSIEEMSFYTETVNFEYESMYVQSSIKCVIEPSVHSSISIYNKKKERWVRFSTVKEKINNHGFPIEVIEPKFILNEKTKSVFEMPYVDEYKKNRVLCYKIGNKLNLFNRIRKYGVPLFKSYDFICFLTSMLLEKEFFTTFIETDYYEIWQNSWSTLDFDDLMNDIKTNKKENNYETVSLIVSKYPLRIDSLEYFFKNSV